MQVLLRILKDFILQIKVLKTIMNFTRIRTSDTTKNYDELMKRLAPANIQQK